MLFHHGKKFHGRHLERNGDVLIGIHHNHIIGFLVRIKVSPAVVGGNLYAVGQCEVLAGQLRNFSINFHTFYGHLPIVFFTLCGICAGSHSQNEHFHIGKLFVLHHQRRRHGVVVIHTRKPVLFHINGLHTEQNVGGQNHTSVVFLYLQVVVNGLSFIGKVIFPERKRLGMSQDAA